MLTTIEAAKILGVDPSRVRQLARAGTMPYIERGGIYFLHRRLSTRQNNGIQNPARSARKRFDAEPKIRQVHDLF